VRDTKKKTITLGRPRRRWAIILKWILKTSDGGMDWIDLARDGDRWRALANAVTNLRIPLLGIS